MRFVLSSSLLEELQTWRASRPLDRVEREHDAFCLDPGLGPAFFLTADGRVLVDGTSSGHVHLTCLLPRAGQPRNDGPQFLRRLAHDPVFCGELDRHCVVRRGCTTLGHRSRRPCRLG
jgi:hypothetical protein